MSEDDPGPGDGGSHPEPTGGTDADTSSREPEAADATTLSTVRTALTVVLAVVLVLSLGGVVYVAVTPQQTADPHTEFYVLGPDGTAANYPTNLTTGERAEVLLGVVNNEHVETTYTLVIATDSRTIETQTFSVANGDTWEQATTYSLDEPGTVAVQFSLYRGTNTTGTPYRSLRLWTAITDGPEQS